MIDIKKHRHTLKITALLLALVSSALTIFLLYSYQKNYNMHWEQAKQGAVEETRNASKELIYFIDILKPIAQSIANALSKKEFTVEEIETLLKNKKIDEITEVGVAFAPHAFDKKSKLFGRAVVEKDGKIEVVKLEDVYDYSLPENSWFHTPLKSGKEFLEPYASQTAGTAVARYAVPFYRTNAQGKKEPIGVVFTSQSHDHLQHIIETLFLGQNGYWFILTEKGTFLAYPQLKYRSKTIFDIATDLRNEALAQTARKIIAGESVLFEYNNEITGARSWLISNPIEGTPWSIVGVFDEEELNLDSNAFRHKLMLPSFSFLLSVLCIVLFILFQYGEHTIQHWSLAMAVFSCGLLIQISWMWYAIYYYPFKPYEPNIYRVENRIKLYEYMKDNFGTELSPQADKHKDLTLKQRLLKMIPHKEYIPTGIYINSLQFAEANEIKFSAYFWQRFTKGLHDKIPRGFVFIQTNDANITEESKILDRDGQDEIITYDVFAKLYQFLTYTLYPFDEKSLRIKYWSKTSDETFNFVPDLNSYQLINPGSLPGLDPEVHLPGWKIIATYFGFQRLPYTTNFGSYSIGAFGVYRELDISAEAQPFFEIIVRRNLADALVSDLLPIAVIAVLLFLVLLVSGPDNDKYLTTIASIFFATIFAQIRFRSKIPQAQIVYLESLYFILYIIMLILLIACFLAQYNIKIKYLTANNNRTLKILYWPFLLGSFAAVSVFYLW